MKRTVSLFEFMPYGAPELLAAGRPDLARALVLSSLAASLFFLAATQIVPMMSDVVKLIPATPRKPVVIIENWEPEAFKPETPLANVSQPVHAKPDIGVPLPVADFIDPPPLAPGSDGPTDVADDPGVVATGPPTSPGNGSTAEPKRGVVPFVDELPQLVYQFKPDYPEFPKQAGVEGLVVVHALIGLDGRVIRVEVDEKFSIPMLNETARDAALRFKFTPALANGHPVVVWYAIPFRFSLHN